MRRDKCLRHNVKYKVLCPRGTQTCALAVANIKTDRHTPMTTTNIKVNGNGKVMLDTHPESDQHQNWTCSRGSPPAPTHQIWWWSMNPFLRYVADKRVRTDTQTHRHTDRHTPMTTRPCGLRRAGKYWCKLRQSNGCAQRVKPWFPDAINDLRCWFGETRLPSSWRISCRRLKSMTFVGKNIAGVHLGLFCRRWMHDEHVELGNRSSVRRSATSIPYSGWIGSKFTSWRIALTACRRRQHGAVVPTS